MKTQPLVLHPGPHGPDPHQGSLSQPQWGLTRDQRPERDWLWMGGEKHFQMGGPGSRQGLVQKTINSMSQSRRGPIRRSSESALVPINVSISFWCSS